MGSFVQKYKSNVSINNTVMAILHKFNNMTLTVKAILRSRSYSVRSLRMSCPMCYDQCQRFWKGNGNNTPTVAEPVLFLNSKLTK